MNIVVCVKQVPDTNEVKIDQKTNNLVREGVPSILNPYDRNSVEMALQLREQSGGKVTVVSMGPLQAQGHFNTALRWERMKQYCSLTGQREVRIHWLPDIFCPD